METASTEAFFIATMAILALMVAGLHLIFWALPTYDVREQAVRTVCLQYVRWSWACMAVMIMAITVFNRMAIR